MCMILYGQDDGEMRRMVLQELIHRFDCLPETYWFAQPFPLNRMCNYRLIIPLVMHV